MSRDAPAIQGPALERLALQYMEIKSIIERWGRRYDEDVLLPETVRYHGIQVGRFEVTRAQFAAFDPSYRFAPGSENLPATGITFAQAKKYAEWLGDRTGLPYRLPTAEEAESLRKAAGPGGNTHVRPAVEGPGASPCGP